MTVEEGVPVLDREAVRVRVDVRVPVVDFVEVFVPVGDDVNDGEMVDEGVTELLGVEELDALEVPLDDPEADDEADDVGEPPPPNPRPTRSSAGASDSGKSREARGAAAVGGCSPASGRDDAPSARRRRRGSERGDLGRVCVWGGWGRNAPVAERALGLGTCRPRRRTQGQPTGAALTTLRRSMSGARMCVCAALTKASKHQINVALDRA